MASNELPNIPADAVYMHQGWTNVFQTRLRGAFREAGKAAASSDVAHTTFNQAIIAVKHPKCWKVQDPEVQALRNLGRRINRTYRIFPLAHSIVHGSNLRKRSYEAALNKLPHISYVQMKEQIYSNVAAVPRPERDPFFQPMDKLLCSRSRLLLILCSVKNCVRVGRNSHLKLMPYELLKHLGEALPESDEELQPNQ